MNDAPVRASSFLPSIKCSNCNADIPISCMGDHVCSQAASLEEAHVDAFDGPSAPRRKPVPTAQEPLKPSLPITQRLDVNNHNHSTPSIRLPFTSNSSTTSNSRSASPAPSLSSRKPLPYQLPPRSMTTPLPVRPPSSDVAVAQGSAFPVFPIPKPRSATHTNLSTSFSFPSEPDSERQKQEFNLRPPLIQSKSKDTDNMLKRMDSIAPGPFDVKTSTNQESQKSAHRKSPSRGSSTDFSRPTSSGTTSHIRRPSASCSVYTRTRSTSTVSGVSRFDWDASSVPSVPSIPKEQHSSSQKTHAPQLSIQDSNFDFGPVTHPDRAHTFPQDELTPKVKKPPERRPSETSMYTHKPRPSVAAAMQPLNSIGSSSSFKPSRSIQGRNTPSAVNRLDTTRGDNIAGRGNDRLQDVPTVPAPTLQVIRNPESPTHTPHESTSSNGSYSSGIRSGSSRSSPPLAESPKRRLQEVSEQPRNDNMFNDFQFGVDSRSPAESPVLPPPHVFAPPEPEVYVPTGPMRPPSESARPTLPIIEPFALPPTRRPTIPNIEPQLPPLAQTISPVLSPDDYLVSSFDAQPQPQSQQYSPPQSHGFRLSPAPPRISTPVSSGSGPHRARPPDKGPCRGCGELIIGKSVSSADGRLSGKYHKGCFVCKTCNSPFQTADFYVMRNHPYCGRHYHELNQSLCHGCDRGIEGQYLETQTRRKFHSYCFTCQDCHKILRDDYFEWNGRTLCEQHAFRAAQQPSSTLSIGGDSRRYPERRTTKLMMM